MSEALFTVGDIIEAKGQTLEVIHVSAQDDPVAGQHSFAYEIVLQSEAETKRQAEAFKARQLALHANKRAAEQAKAEQLAAQPTEEVVTPPANDLPPVA